MNTIDQFTYVTKQLDIPVVLTCDPHFQTPDQASYQEVLHSIRDRREFDESRIIREGYQWPADELFEAVKTLFPSLEWETIFENVNRIADSCSVEMPTGSVPRFPMSEEDDAKDLLFQLCAEGVKTRGLNTLSSDARKVYADRLRKELQLIQSKDYSDYFLIVSDICRWSKENGILVGPARGSAAGSLVCFLTGITEINPLEHDLVFERFIDESRYDLPDIDIDFEDDRREEVKTYMAEKYGEDKVCSVATFAAFKGKNSLDEVGKSFQIPKGDISTVKKFLIDRSGGDMRSELTIKDTFEMSEEPQKIMEQYPDLRYSMALEGQLRHMGKHAAGVIVGDRPLQEIIALYQRDGKQLSSVEMKDATSLGLVKIDILGITELSILSRAAALIGMDPLDYYNISLTDEKTMQGFRDLDVGGIFQFEGDSTKSVLRQIPNLNDFEQLAACVALSKPGPAHSGGTTKYLARAKGATDVKGFDWHPILARITEPTYYQIIYQEQVISIVREIGQMTWTDANAIRLFMSKSQGEQAFEEYRPAFKKGAIANGLTETSARSVWDETKTMGRWAFNKSHAVSYAMLSWWSMYMKQHHPLEFYLARLLKEGKVEKRIRLLMEVSNRGISVLPPKIGMSQSGWSIEEGKALRAGLMEIKGIGAKMAERIIETPNQTRQEFEDNKVTGVSKKKLDFFEENFIFSDQEDVVDFFGLKKYDVLAKISPKREILGDIEDGSDTYPIEIAGLFVEMNYKDIHEERRSRGQSTENIKSPEIAKYAMMLLEDETDRCLVMVDRFVFNKIGQKVWNAYNNELFVVIRGHKIKGWRMIRAKDMKVFDPKKVNK